jgi:hypothetical protein
LPTSPGTDIKVTPEREAPTIPKATRYQGEFRFAVKNVWEFAFFEVKCEISRSTAK